MSKVALSTPSVLVNNVPIGIVPNTFEYEPGFGEINVRSQSIGGGATVSVHTEDAEGKIAMMKFQMHVTDDARLFIRDWKSRIGTNALAAVTVSGAPIVMGGASMTNNPTFAATADGTVEVEFKGDPMPTP